MICEPTVLGCVSDALARLGAAEVETALMLEVVHHLVDKYRHIRWIVTTPLSRHEYRRPTRIVERDYRVRVLASPGMSYAADIRTRLLIAVADLDQSGLRNKLYRRHTLGTRKSEVCSKPRFDLAKEALNSRRSRRRQWR